MTPGEIIIIVGAFCAFIILGQYLHARHELDKRYAEGWAAGWDDRHHDWPPETPEPKGRHHGLSQPEDWTATDLIEFTLPPPPLPKRKPAGYTQKRQGEG